MAKRTPKRIQLQGGDNYFEYHRGYHGYLDSKVREGTLGIPEAFMISLPMEARTIKTILMKERRENKLEYLEGICAKSCPLIKGSALNQRPQKCLIFYFTIYLKMGEFTVVFEC